ncbi:MAG: UDP-N-acetylmuramoyl-tripeptide--D-alanyl-D-alanine ligase [Chlamydiae bacterium]|nr:UDP-N-acetylmuramoyl-tripeptide--D-alanyl-D-alanine ligase [Chlamydiota bacterium]
MKTRYLQDIASELGLPGVSFPNPIKGYKADSRKVEEGDLFFSITGQRTDGHLHLKEVAERGAVAAVVSKSYQGEDFGLHLFYVDDVRDSLQELARRAVQNRKVPIVAVTGSIGKTTTKEFISHLLSAKYRVGRTPGNANSQVGFPLALLSMTGEEEVLVLEMGMTEYGHIQKLVSIAPPDIAVVTKIDFVHVDAFEGREGISEAKAEIFSSPKTRLGVINIQAMQFSSLAEAGDIPKITYGFSDADFVVDAKTQEFCDDKGQKMLIDLPFTATHMTENFLGAVVVARELGLSYEEIREQAKTLAPFHLRFETVEIDGVTYLNDCYNASLESMKAAFVNIPKNLSAKRRIAILGEIKNLGSFSEFIHQSVAEIAVNHFDQFICYGQGCLAMEETFVKKGLPAKFFSDFALLQEHVEKTVSSGDFVLIKGSNGNQLWRLLESKKI